MTEEIKGVEVMVEHRESDQVFSYFYGDGTPLHVNDMLHFNVTLLDRLRKVSPEMASQFRRVTMQLGADEYDLTMQHRGIEEPKVKRLTEAQRDEPGYAVILPNGSYTIVDGHHRLVRRYRDGRRSMEFYFCMRNVWNACLVEYTDEGNEKIRAGLPPRVADAPMIATAIKVQR